ncbi:hypothetical protein RL72_01166 [Microbacterium azadirachtae]|uniref:Uncharacterized protein n=1 Tax=Microbacterium azadirachtae TaxID=582680 RepID=A0A0F0KYH2_9MICO|nr:hypothetical protein RL72_01166 [Microbacterium azadirachtae]
MYAWRAASAASRADSSLDPAIAASGEAKDSALVCAAFTALSRESTAALTLEIRAGSTLEVGVAETATGTGAPGVASAQPTPSAVTTRPAAIAMA